MSQRRSWPLDRRRRVLPARALVAASLLVVAGCSSHPGRSAEGSHANASSPSVTTATSSTVPTVPTDAAAAVDISTDDAASIDPRINEWALRYVGGSARQAVGDPFRIGFASGTASDFQEAAAAVDYLNKELGGVGGHPLELVLCDATQAATLEEQSAFIAPCGTAVANNPSVHMVLIGDLFTLDSSFTDIVGASMPVYVDYGYQNAGVSYNPNGVETLAAAAILIARDLQPRFSRVILIDPVDVKDMVRSVLPDVDLVAVPIYQFTPKTTAEVVNLIAATGATSDDLFLIQAPDCQQIIEALHALQLNPTVVAGGGCFNDIPDGWYKVNLGWNPDAPDLDTGALTASTKLHSYFGGAPHGPRIFADVLTVAKIINQVGADAATPARLRSALYGFTGTAMLGRGPADCLGSTALDLPALGNCATTVDAYLRRDGGWVELAPIVVDVPEVVTDFVNHVRKAEVQQAVDLLVPDSPAATKASAFLGEGIGPTYPDFVDDRNGHYFLGLGTGGRGWLEFSDFRISRDGQITDFAMHEGGRSVDPTNSAPFRPRVDKSD